MSAAMATAVARLWTPPRMRPPEVCAPEPAAAEKWPHSLVIALSRPRCTTCRGSGYARLPKEGLRQPCKCVLRAVFRECRRQWWRGKMMAYNRWRMTAGRGRKGGWSVPALEYVADFERLARSVLTRRKSAYGDLWPLFELHYLRGYEWRVCCWRLRISRGDFYHAAYVAEEIVGRACRELLPYPLHPIYPYMHPRHK